VLVNKIGTISPCQIRTPIALSYEIKYRSIRLRGDDQLAESV